ncbi:MAG: hypothetical protein IPJ13_28340 [Saprospiraceae bacterium]|nr:hypothetical protein [Saprospiraceae bacterium]
MKITAISWYGRGPGENYWDRKTNTFIGQYRQNIDEQYYPYAGLRKVAIIQKFDGLLQQCKRQEDSFFICR